MDIVNLTLVGQIITGFAVFTACLGYYLGKRKTETPVTTALIGFVSALVPPIALIFLIVLILKADLQPQTLEK